jgi:hypothetical protein
VLKIDLSQVYPCPCCRGKLQQIVLAEALGCDQCQKIFVLQADGCSIEHTSSPYRDCWQWNGRRWQQKKTASQSSWILIGGLALTTAFAIGSWQLFVPPEKTGKNMPEHLKPESLKKDQIPMN